MLQRVSILTIVDTLYEQNIFGFDLLDTLKTFESDDFV